MEVKNNKGSDKAAPADLVEKYEECKKNQEKMRCLRCNSSCDMEDKYCWKCGNYLGGYRATMS